MICRRCSNDVKNGIKYCPHCGNLMKTELLEIALNVVYAIIITLVLFFIFLKNPFGNLIAFYIIAAILIFLSSVAITNSYNKIIISVAMIKNLLISAIAYGIFYIFTGSLLSRGFIDKFTPMASFFISIIAFIACIKKYEIRHFILINYNHFKKKCSK